MEHMRKNGGDYILRYRAKGFKLYDKEGEVLELLPKFRGLQKRESAHVDCCCRENSGELRPVRVIAMTKDTAVEAASRRKKQYKVRDRQKGPIPQEMMELNSYILLAMSLRWTDVQIQERYRARWQIELVSHRLKGIYGFGEVSSKNPDSVKAWFYGKLLLAALCEAVIKKENFPPVKKSSRLVMPERSIWGELSLVFKFLHHAIWNRCGLFRLPKSFLRRYLACAPSHRPHAPALLRLALL